MGKEKKKRYLNKNIVFEGCHHADSSRELNFYFRVKKKAVIIFTNFFFFSISISNAT